MTDPTHGRIDPDIQADVDDMNPRSVGSRVALENTAQNRRDASPAAALSWSRSQAGRPYNTGELLAEIVNHPSHYGGDTTYEAIKVIDAWKLGFSLGNAVKYICRAGAKGNELEDLRKAAWYLQHEIELLEQNQVAACDDCGWIGNIDKVTDGKCPRNCTRPLRYFAGGDA